ncbi:MAG: potassium channel protein [Candidatus Brockarchaeota archaeon]|nr:potassium channel protein [Candidatus Brockarchaeota archaeon]
MRGEIKYKPVSVRDILTELQTTTTLMIDLAYSAVVFNDKDLAEDVVEMAGKVDELKTRLLMNTAIAVRDADDAETMVGVMQVGAVAYRISGAAADIARTVLLGLVPDPRVLEALAKTKEGLVRTRILPNSVLAGKPLGKLKLETNIGVNVIVVRRGKELLTNPGPEVSLAEGDVLIARGSDVGVSELDKLAKGELKAIPRPKLGEKEGA